jgi:hypothetical protein
MSGVRAPMLAALLSGGFLCLVGCAPAPDLSEIAPLKGRVAGRQAVLTQMKTEGLCLENSTGVLGRSPTAKLSLEHRTLIEEENFDRERIFDALSRAYGLPSSEIKSLFVEMQGCADNPLIQRGPGNSNR